MVLKLIFMKKSTFYAMANRYKDREMNLMNKKMIKYYCSNKRHSTLPDGPQASEHSAEESLCPFSAAYQYRPFVQALLHTAHTHFLLENTQSHRDTLHSITHSETNLSNNFMTHLRTIYKPHSVTKNKFFTVLSHSWNFDVALFELRFNRVKLFLLCFRKSNFTIENKFS